MVYKGHSIRADLNSGFFIASKNGLDTYQESTLAALKERIDKNVKRDLAISQEAKIFIINHADKIEKGRVTSVETTGDVWISLAVTSHKDVQRQRGRIYKMYQSSIDEQLYLLTDDALVKAAQMVDIRAKIKVLEKQYEKISKSIPKYKVPKTE